ncbi:MAG: type I DNA topoisomerase [Oscillospiraceae bacterium]|nr:type I DNA topoisomerase [Oscillospiraceae bacterium]
MSKLVIVESPAKAKTIGKYLGKGYIVKATMGHVRDLPKSKMGVDIDNGYAMEYKPLEGKQETVRALEKDAKKADAVYLATDPDREGEAISWHLKEMLNLDDDKALRVVFNEITPKVVKASIDNPRAIDMDLVDAQQARRVLDRIVGYQLSPLLWKKIKSRLSAGRVQSVATRLVVDREEEIRAFNPEEYWEISVDLERINAQGAFKAKFYGNADGRVDLSDEASTQNIVNDVQNAPFSVHNCKNTEKKRNPAPPFITSTLQQDASRKFNMTAKRVMAIAQQLYEGIELTNGGLTGLITYMRTDSLRLSDDAVAEARDYIKQRFGDAYLPAAPRVFKSKKNAQDAHEAIRPSQADLSPDMIRDDLSADQYKVYKLIWARFMACQMSHAVYDTLTIDTISAGWIFRANHTQIKFAGFTAIYEESNDDDEKAESPLPNLTKGEPLSLQTIDPSQHFTQPPARYNEATLIRAMEERGIGRPSTYAPTISTIQDREYVLKEGKALRPTPLGEVVTGFMKDKFTDVIDVEFSARMESLLDEVESGKKPWKQLLDEFYATFSKSMAEGEASLAEGRLKIPDEESDIVCDLCQGPMVIKSGRFGRFLACKNYPECKNTKPLAVEAPGTCPTCGAKILKKKSKKGYAYYGCEKNPDCPFMSWDAPTSEICADCGKSLFKKSGKGNNKSFCINAECVSFLPEDQRGYYKKKAKTDDGEKDNEAPDGAPPEKKPAAKKKAPAKKKPAAKKPAAKEKA